MNYSALQSEVGTWSREQFGEQSRTFPLMGVNEELGELAHSCQQNERDEVIDGIGDVMLYLADFCSLSEIELERCSRDYPAPHGNTDTFQQLLWCAGLLNRSVLKQKQGIRLGEPRVGKEAEREAIGSIIRTLERVCVAYNTTLDECIGTAWGEVGNRSWDAEVSDE